MEILVGTKCILNHSSRFGKKTLAVVIKTSKTLFTIDIINEDGVVVEVGRVFSKGTMIERGCANDYWPARIMFPQIRYGNPESPEDHIAGYYAKTRTSDIVSNNKKLIRDFVALMDAGKISNKSIDAVSTAAALAIIKYSEEKAS